MTTAQLQYYENWGKPELIIERFDKLGIIPHTLPNAIGMWPNEQECLVWCATQCNPNENWWEIGSFCGGSTVLLGLTQEHMEGNGNIIAVDPAPKPIMDLNIKRAKLNNRIVRSKMTSQYALDHNDSPIGFMFLDGYHSFRSVITEFQLAQKHLTDDAIIAFHDCSPNMWKHNEQYVHDLGSSVYNIYDQLMANQEQDFYIDEAIAYICDKYDYKIIDISIRQPLAYHKETGLNEWVRGRTSPHNAFTAIRKTK
jgi:predicted O-methyltransferase YrrM